MCICIVFLVLVSVLHWRSSFYFQYHSSRWDPRISHLSSLHLSLDLCLFHFDSKSRGFSTWRSIIFPVLLSLCSLYTLLLVFGLCLFLPCISSVVLFIPFLSIMRRVFSICLAVELLSSWDINRDHLRVLPSVAILYTSYPLSQCT